jgi:phenylpyruvate tautomerase PptA (4-oxalocrotonate tautomerase family)
MPSISIDCCGLDEAGVNRIAGTVRARVVAAMPEVAGVCSCRVTRCDAAALPDGTALPAAWAEVRMFPGRTLDQKRTLYAAIAAGCADAGIAASAVTVTVLEPEIENWGIRGGRSAADVLAQPA